MNFLKSTLLITSVVTLQVARAELPEYEVVTSKVPRSSYGTITRLTVFSENLGGKVTVDVWTPTHYDPSSYDRYPVVYVHDGQNLFDASFSFASVPWAVDRACSQLAADADFVMPILVGINNRGAEGLRPNDYFPENALEYISPDQKENTFIYETCNNKFLGNKEASFVAEELKPLIDNLYITAPGASTTFAMGSSMGALASMYLMCEYPEVFGGAVCMSTHWIGSLSLNADYTMNDDEVCANAILQYISENLPDDGRHRLYMDQGTKDWDAGYLKYEVTAREIVKAKGYTEETGQLYVYDAIGAGHNEWYWQQRVKTPLKFILSKAVIESMGVDGIKADPQESSTDNMIYDLYGNGYSISAHADLPPGLYIMNGKKLIKH